jgi:tryptophanyl-tRNA synthetase
MAPEKPVLVSGVKPSGDLHIGNYFGAMRQFVALTQEGKYRPFIFVADYHALNTLQDAEEMRRRIRELVAAYIAIGLKPENVVFFKQSDVPAHTELAWIFDTITTMPYLMRAHAFKDAEAKNKEISIGTFNYPMLMAADILLYDAAVVPVGQDQKQHIEIARDTAEKFNRTYKTDVFALPEPYIMPEVAVVPGIDGQKMSKSYGNVIPLFGSAGDVAESVMSIVTDSGTDEEMNTLMEEEKMGTPVPKKILRPMNLFRIHRLVRSEAELQELYLSNQSNYKVIKEALIADLEQLLSPIRAKYTELMANPATIDEILQKGKQAAREASEKKMEIVRRAIGVA